MRTLKEFEALFARVRADNLANHRAEGWYITDAVIDNLPGGEIDQRVSDETDGYTVRLDDATVRIFSGQARYEILPARRIVRTVPKGQTLFSGIVSSYRKDAARCAARKLRVLCRGSESFRSSPWRKPFPLLNRAGCRPEIRGKLRECAEGKVLNRIYRKANEHGS